MKTVSIVGVGRVGGALALSLPKQEYSVETLVVNGDAGEVPIADDLFPRPAVVAFDELAEINSDLIFITTQDAQIASAARALSGKIAGSSVIFHTSGSYPSTILDALRVAGCQTGSLHPLVSISKAELGPKRFPGAYFCIEGDPAAVEIGRQIVADLGGVPFSIDTRFKTLYHASAVTACGHLVALFDASVEMMTKCGLSAEDSKSILMPLVTSTVRNLSELPTDAALTGTFARADLETFTRHLTALNENVSDDLLEIYLLLGERSLELAARQGVSHDRIERLRAKVSIAKSKLKW
jgi:predicted short-subunit dehydrogenase-like oxidoreductase (DUF2520 family)